MCRYNSCCKFCTKMRLIGRFICIYAQLFSSSYQYFAWNIIASWFNQLACSVLFWWELCIWVWLELGGRRRVICCSSKGSFWTVKQGGWSSNHLEMWKIKPQCNNVLPFSVFVVFGTYFVWTYMFFCIYWIYSVLLVSPIVVLYLGHESCPKYSVTFSKHCNVNQQWDLTKSLPKNRTGWIKRLTTGGQCGCTTVALDAWRRVCRTGTFEWIILTTNLEM